MFIITVVSLSISLSKWQKFDTWPLKLFDSFILIHYDCVRRMFTSFIRYLFKWIWFFVFQIKMKNEKQTSNLNFNVQLFWKSENHLFWCFLSQLQYRNKNQNLISNFIFQFIKKTKQNEMARWVNGLSKGNLTNNFHQQPNCFLDLFWKKQLD